MTYRYQYELRLLKEIKSGNYRVISCYYSITYQGLAGIRKQLPLPERRFCRWKIQLRNGDKLFEKVYYSTAKILPKLTELKPHERPH